MLWPTNLLLWGIWMLQLPENAANMKDCEHNEVMREMFAHDPAFAVECLRQILFDHDLVDLRALTKQLPKHLTPAEFLTQCDPDHPLTVEERQWLDASLVALRCVGASGVNKASTA